MALGVSLNAIPCAKRSGVAWLCGGLGSDSLSLGVGVELALFCASSAAARI